MSIKLIWFVLSTTMAHAFEIPCVRSFSPSKLRFAEVRSQEALTWPQMHALCYQEHPGYGLLIAYEYLEQTVLDMCGDKELVPFGILAGKNGAIMWNSGYGLSQEPLLEVDKAKLKLNFNTSSWGSLHWPSNGVDMVGNETRFLCAVCELYERSNIVAEGIYPPHNNSDYSYDLELVSNDRIEDIGVLSNGSDLMSRLLDDLAEAFNISVKALRWHGVKLNEDHKAVVHVYYNREGDQMDWFHYLHWNDEYVEHKTLENFHITMVKLNTECISDKELKHVNEKVSVVGTLDYSFDLPSNVVTLRECYWDASTGSAMWSPMESWNVQWKPCSYDQLKQMDNYNAMLRTLDLSAAFQFQYLVENAPDSFDLRGMLGGINLNIKVHSSKNSNTTLAFITSANMENIATMFMRNTTQNDEKKTLSYRYPNVHIMQSSQNDSYPYVGAAISKDSSKSSGSIAVQEMQLGGDTQLANGTLVVVTVSESIAKSADQLTVAFYATHKDDHDNLIQDPAFGSWLTVVQVTYHQTTLGEDEAREDFVDIAFAPEFRESSMAGNCAEWSFHRSMWSGKNCRLQSWKRDTMPVCRCRNLHRLTNTSDTTGVYIVYGYDASMSSYLAENSEMIKVTAITLFFSVLAILSIWATAVAFKEWRSKPSSKILLQLTIALGVNAALCTMTNFWKLDKTSVTCVIVGVIRHYSFQAMYYWMLVLSVWQMKVFTSTDDPSVTSGLLAKLSLFAWGCPLIPIIILLAWDVGFYRSIISNRGYCYPEGTAFQLTVQAPAGAVLALNFILFAYVVVRNYGCYWRDDALYRRQNGGKRTKQIRRLTKIIVLFCIFGFAWLFHFLSEEGIINNEFAFEFCFIITVAVYLCLLSFFFVCLNAEVRHNWLEAWNRRMMAMGWDFAVLSYKPRYGSFGGNSGVPTAGNFPVRMNELLDELYVTQN